jgi:plastocyanin
MSTTIERPLQTVAAGTERGDRFVAGTLLALALVLAAYQLVTAPFIPPLTLFTVLFAAAGVAVRRWPSRRGLVAAGVLALLYLVGGAPVFVTHLSHPESPLGFLFDAVIVTGLLTVLAGVVTALRGGPRRSRRRIAAAAGALAVVAAVVAASAARTVGSDAPLPDDVAITVLRWVFPDVVEVPAGATALWIDNQDPFHHTIVIEGTDVRAALPASTAVRVQVALAEGRYRFLCDVPGHEAMAGELHVADGAE